MGRIIIFVVHFIKSVHYSCDNVLFYDFQFVFLILLYMTFHNMCAISWACHVFLDHGHGHIILVIMI